MRGRGPPHGRRRSSPFVGSGTTLAAAKAAGIAGVGIERSEAFCRMAADAIGSLTHSVDDDSLFGVPRG